MQLYSIHESIVKEEHACFFITIYLLILFGLDTSQVIKTTDYESVETLSGRAELNRRPLRPERSALTGLSHAPSKQGAIIPART